MEQCRIVNRTDLKLALGIYIIDNMKYTCGSILITKRTDMQL